MIQAQTQTNPTPVTEPAKTTPETTGPQQTDAEKQALADKAKAEANPSVKS